VATKIDVSMNGYCYSERYDGKRAFARVL